MCVLVMMNRVISYLIQYPRRVLYYVLFGVLGVLLLLLAINDKNWKPLKSKKGWEAISNYSQLGVPQAIDQDLETWWSSYFAMTFGMYFQVDIGQPVVMNGVLLRVGKERQGQPTEWVLKTSVDGESWDTPETRNGLVYRSMLVIPFEPIQARYVQITQTAVASSVPSPWFIYEFDILQPVVPWHFARSTLLLVILAWGLVIVGVMLFLHRQHTFCSPVVLTILMLIIMLFGWLLRVYDLRPYEFSDHEDRYFSQLEFHRSSDGEWLKTYFERSKSGAYCLTLLLIRWANRFGQSQLAAFRIVSAVFGIGLVFLIYFIWGMFSQDENAGWEALAASALVSFAGWPIWLSRSGDFSASLLCIFLLYLFVGYRFLYKRGTYVFALLLAILLPLGLLLHPMMSLVPIGLLLFGGSHLLLCKVSPGFLQAWHVQSYHLRHNLPRFVIYLLSILPGCGYWLIFLREGDRVSAFAWQNLGTYGTEILRMLAICGISGITVWIFWGLVLVGFWQIVSARGHGEWFFFFQGGLFILFCAFGSLEARHASLFLLVLMLFLLGVRGILWGITFLGPRLKERPHQRICTGILSCVAGYILLFSLNSFFIGSPTFPYSSGAFAEYQARKHFTDLARHIRQDPKECKQIVTLDRQFAGMFSANYGARVDVLKLAELQRWADQGFLYPYMFSTISHADKNRRTARFLKHYYTEIGRSSQVILYYLREEFHNLPQRYYARDLFFNIGYHFEDPQAPQALVRFAKPEYMPGLLAFGPYCRVCRSGKYIARFVLRVLERPEEPVAILEVVPDYQEVLAKRELRGTEFPDSSDYHSFDVPFDMNFFDNPAYQMKRLQFFVQFTAKTELRLYYIELIPEEERH